MPSEARDLVSGRLREHLPPPEGRGVLRGPGRTAKGVQKSCREKNPPTGGLLQLLLTPQPECTPACMEGGHSMEPGNQM